MLWLVAKSAITLLEQVTSDAEIFSITIYELSQTDKKHSNRTRKSTFTAECQANHADSYETWYKILWTIHQTSLENNFNEFEIVVDENRGNSKEKKICNEFIPKPKVTGRNLGIRRHEH